MAHDTRDMTCHPITPPIVPARPAGHRLGPLVEWHRVDGPLAGRLYALLIAGICLAVLATAAWMTPSHDHMGTHCQLGLPPCAFVAVTGFPCPTCGMTTSFAWLIHGHPLEAGRSSLFGTLLALATLAVTAAAIGCTVAGRYPNLNWYRIDAVKLVYYGALLLVLSWGVKIAVGLLDGSLPVS